MRRFFLKTKRVGDCLEWQSGRDVNGYGYWRYQGRRMRATHWAWLMEYGYKPNQINHHCDNPACVDIRHLQEGTQRQNMEQMAERGRSALGLKNGKARTPGAAICGALLLRKQGWKQREVAEMFGVHPTTVGSWEKGRTRRVS